MQTERQSIGKDGKGVKPKWQGLTGHQGIIPAFAGTSSAALVRLRRIAFLPEAGKRSLLPPPPRGQACGVFIIDMVK